MKFGVCFQIGLWIVDEFLDVVLVCPLSLFVVSVRRVCFFLRELGVCVDLLFVVQCCFVFVFVLCVCVCVYICIYVHVCVGVCRCVCV